MQFKKHSVLIIVIKSNKSKDYSNINGGLKD